MSGSFTIINVPDDAAELTETMGSKPKFWFRRADYRRYLYKQTRPGTGEDWAENIAAELCGLLGLPHAEFELACWRHTRGVVTPSFVPQGGCLVHGNEVLRRVLPNYPSRPASSRQFCRVPQHTVDAVLEVVGILQPPRDWPLAKGIDSALGVFVGYLLLDAWIGNTDRHDENWALVARVPQDQEGELGLYLAPTYDHSSSLGRNETDERRMARLATSDRGFSVGAYVERTRSALYDKEDDRKPLTTIEAFVHAARRCRVAARTWLERLRDVSAEDTRSLLHRVPKDRISGPAIRFAQAILQENQRRLLDCERALS